MSYIVQDPTSVPPLMHRPNPGGAVATAPFLPEVTEVLAEVVGKSHFPEVEVEPEDTK